MPRKIKASDLSRRQLLALMGGGSAAALAGCAGGIGGGGDGGSGSGSGSGGGEFASEIGNLDFGANWEERRFASLDDWPLEKRQQIPEGDALYEASGWLDSESVKSATWEPPSGWDDTAAADVDKIQILNYGDMQFDPATAATDALFEDRTGITMERIEVVVDQAIPKAAAFLSAKETQPEMFLSTTYSSMSTYASNGHIQAADYLQPKDEMWDPYLPIAKQTFNWNGTQWVGPNIVEGKVVHVRPKLIADQGVDQSVIDSILNGEWTWDELETVMEAFAGTDTYGWAYRGSSLTYTENDWREMWYQAGGQYVQDDGTIKVNDEAALLALNKMVEWKDKGWVPEAVNTYTQGDLADGFLSEQFAMVPVATDLIADSAEKFGTGEEYQITVGTKGSSEAPDPQRATLATTTGTAINAYTDVGHKVAGALFQDARFSLASSWWEYVVEGNMCYAEQAYSDAAETDAATFSEAKAKAMETARSEVFPQQRAINQKVSQELQLAIAGDKEPQAALDAAQEYINTVLGQ